MRILRYVRIIERMTEPAESKNWRGFGRKATGGIVGVIAAIASFDHQRGLALRHGQHGFLSDLFPISVDVLILCATFAMDGRNRFWPRAAFWAGVGATISANVLAAPPDLLSQVISAWAPVALLFVIEIEARRNKVERWQWRRNPAVNTEPVPAGDPAEPAKPRQRNRRGQQTAQKVAQVAARKPDAKPTQIAAQLGLSESTVRRELKHVNGSPITQTPAQVPA